MGWIACIQEPTRAHHHLINPQQTTPRRSGPQQPVQPRRAGRPNGGLNGNPPPLVDRFRSRHRLVRKKLPPARSRRRRRRRRSCATCVRCCQQDRGGSRAEPTSATPPPRTPPLSQQQPAVCSRWWFAYTPRTHRAVQPAAGLANDFHVQCKPRVGGGGGKLKKGKKGGRATRGGSTDGPSTRRVKGKGDSVRS